MSFFVAEFGNFKCWIFCSLSSFENIWMGQNPCSKKWNMVFNVLWTSDHTIQIFCKSKRNIILLNFGLNCFWAWRWWWRLYNCSTLRPLLNGPRTSGRKVAHFSLFYLFNLSLLMMKIVKIILTISFQPIWVEFQINHSFLTCRMIILILMILMMRRWGCRWWSSFLKAHWCFLWRNQSEYVWAAVKQ